MKIATDQKTERIISVLLDFSAGHALADLSGTHSVRSLMRRGWCREPNSPNLGPGFLANYKETWSDGSYPLPWTSDARKVDSLTLLHGSINDFRAWGSQRQTMCLDLWLYGTLAMHRIGKDCSRTRLMNGDCLQPLTDYNSHC